MNNAITQVQFPGGTLEKGLEIVVGTRIEQYLKAHPYRAEAEAYQAARSSIQSAAVPVAIDAVIDGKGRYLRAIASLPTNVQLAAGCEAIALEFLADEGNEEIVAFGSPVLDQWLTDCESELKQQIYDYFQKQL